MPDAETAGLFPGLVAAVPPPAGGTDRAGDFDSCRRFGSPFGVETRPLGSPAALRSLDPRRRSAQSPAHRLPR